MAVTTRKKSPRAPSISLEEALERVMKVYDKERLHEAPVEVVAQDMGYKTANNGAALQTIASLRYYGLLDRPRDGHLAVTKDVEAYRFSPDDKITRSLLLRFLRTPPLFAELLDKYPTGLPSENNLKYELIQREFLPSTAGTLVSTFKRSVEFAQYFNGPVEPPPAPPPSAIEAPTESWSEESTASTPSDGEPPRQQRPSTPEPFNISDENSHDRIPIRLSGGRRAWLLIPMVFREADKQRLKAQIDLLLTEDEEG